MDLLMGGFADAHLTHLDAAGLAAFEGLLSAPDQEVYDWILGRATPPIEHDTPTLGLLRSFRFFAHNAPNPGSGQA